jgi:hypothetical protein
MELAVIYDGVLSASDFNLSETFTGGQFLYFSAGNDFNDEFEIGVNLVVFAPTIGGGDQAKYAKDLGILNTNAIIPLEREVSESGLTYQLAFGVDSSLSGFRAYVFRSDNSLDSVAADLEQIKELVTQIETAQADILTNQTTQFALDSAIGANQLLQNQAISLIGAGLIPVTAGVTAPVPPLLAGSSLLLLPGL